MLTRTPSETSEPLPYDLSDVYRTYKRGTSIVIRWLHTFDTVGTTNLRCGAKKEEDLQNDDITVREIFDRARKAASMGKRPPEDIQMAFKTVIMNRSTLTKYYESLPVSTQGVQDSTDRHKIFNETLAEAYALLFPAPKKRRSKGSKGTPRTPPEKPTLATKNNFETLAGLIEAEQDSSYSASEYWKEDIPSPNTKRSAIADDPMELVFAVRAYLTEFQAIVETTKAIWTSYAAGEMPLAVAGWLTNFALHFLELVRIKGAKMYNYEEGLFHDFGEFGRPRAATTAEQLASADFSRTASAANFAELTHGCGLIWPTQLFKTFAETHELPPSFEKERGRFETFFRNASEEHEAKKTFAQSVTDLASLDGDQLSDAEREIRASTICADRYTHDRRLLVSMIRGIAQHPAFETHQTMPYMDQIHTHRQFPFRAHMPHPLNLPMMVRVKEKTSCSATVATAHMLLESGRSFLHEYEKMGKSPPNCRIVVLSRANEVLSAMQRLVHKPRGTRVEYYRTFFDVMISLDKKLKIILSDKTFDVYSQSPWVTGSYMSAISDMTLYVGLEILNEQNIFGAVMHLYNMLQQIDGGCDRIPILEELRNAFKSVVFAGGQEPTKDFANVFELFCGAKIYKKLGNARAMLTEAPREEPRTAFCKDQKISMSKMNLSAAISFHNFYTPDMDFWKKLIDDDKFTRKFPKLTSHEELFARFSPSELVRRAREVLRPEYEGSFPIARLNCFAVLDLCTEILIAIARRFKELGSTAWPPEYTRSPGFSNVSEVQRICIKSAISCLRLTMTDVVVEQAGCKNKRDNRLRERPPVVIMRDSIMKVCEGKKVEDFLWKNA